MKISKSNLVFYALLVFGIFVSVISFYILPDHFYNDTRTLVFDEFNEIGLVGSYPFTIWFYNFTGLKHLHFILIGIIQYVIALYMLFKVGIPERFYRLTIKNLLVYFAIVMVAIFLSMPSKEFINFIFIFIIVRLFKKQERGYLSTIVIVLTLLLFFGYFFRPYYILIAILSVVLFLVSKVNFKNKKITTLFYGILVAIIMSLSYGLVKGKFISQKTREDLNETRIGGEQSANSAIVSPLDSSTWYGESFGIVYGFFSVNIPVNGLRHFMSPQIILFVIWQLFLFAILFLRYGRCLKDGTYQNRELWAFFVLFSYFIVQGVFEPDLGSAVRHKIGILPLIYFVLYYDSFRKKV
ncbi:hypothetical protein [Gelidibacter salicanalis]|uniref:Uncharacterized protein n=1 Tax=Gelidibacter salicanalis TaxID=291193 RepID=A0A934NBI7_9FLAO|nr:hypothetical protein [Gelidibacter salicanalis]MBJ7879675.1 hypothetical protein [Gelidibacter salicanalis]